MTPTASVASPAFSLICSGCGAEASGFAGRCESCGGLVDAHYPRPHIDDGARATDAVEHYRDLLPIRDPQSRRLSIRPTPIVELGSVEGVRVLAKVEGVLPTRTTKDRLIAVALPFMLENGVRRFAFSSTGNTAAAYAHGLHLYPELEGCVYLSPNVDRTAIGPVPPNMSVVVVDSDYAGASARVRAHTERGDAVAEGGFFNLGRREGAKLAYLEAFEQLRDRGTEVGAVVQAVASGLGILAAARAISELRRAGRLAGSPRLFCAQQESCAPMVAAYRAEGRGEEWPAALRNPTGIAPSLLLGDPFASYPHVVDAVRASGGSFVAVPDAEVGETLRRQTDPAIPVGASAAVALAAVPRLVQSSLLDPDKAILVLLTGGPGR